MDSRTRVESWPDFGELRSPWLKPSSLADSSMLCTSLDYAFASQHPHTPKFQPVTVPLCSKRFFQFSEHLKSVDWLEYLKDCEPRLVVPVGPRFQADVPEWKGPCNEEFGRRGGANLDDSRWLGIRTWPIKGSCVGAEGGKIGKGRSDSCSCTSPGSSDCIKCHVAEERKRLHSNLGCAF
ncbi:hypothetical protein Nepgr_014083 [Nepenthes gracilis]|uniref:Uncharacterized protein n=1 Tax=Nepenthes gracilis TaxID=150966 RepID=A0AAD3SKE4_NEPGR|nr:hypothetical protein Nepgr_014083 [Nepenthes gracilis]